MIGILLLSGCAAKKPVAQLSIPKACWTKMVLYNERKPCEEIGNGEARCDVKIDFSCIHNDPIH